VRPHLGIGPALPFGHHPLKKVLLRAFRLSTVDTPSILASTKIAIQAHGYQNTFQ
jgi:hypothetical protein